MTRRCLLASLVLAALLGPACAQDVRVYGADEEVDPHDVARILDAPAANPPEIKFRSIRLLVEPGKAKVQRRPNADDQALATAGGGAGPADRVAPAKALALQVRFAFDSADILPEARGQLDALAEGIKLLPPTKTVLIEGHTDAAGAGPYNDQLSLRRARSVKQYLVASHGIDPQRLHTMGLGKEGLLSGWDPMAPEQRRVQFYGD